MDTDEVKGAGKVYSSYHNGGYLICISRLNFKHVIKDQITFHIPKAHRCLLEKISIANQKE